jgi:undecaprenyl diphosphate synthase
VTSIISRILSFFRPQRPNPGTLDPDRIPRHIAIIMDGNGRWAANRGLPRLAGHRAGAKAVRSVVKQAAEVGVEFLTLYTFSSENWRRPKREVDGLMRLFEETLAAEIDELHQSDVVIKVIGDLSQVQESTRSRFERAMEKTRRNTGLTLVVALNYSGRADLLGAINALVAQAVARPGPAPELDEAGLSGCLSTAGLPDPELVIRTSGELRLSNFLIWETAYSEFWVTPVLWPDFRGRDLLEGIGDYQLRDRRFGGLSHGQDHAG